MSPYIPEERRQVYRKTLDELKDLLEDWAKNEGDWAFCINDLLEIMWAGDSWSGKMDAIKVLEGVKLEIWSREIRPYEDDKIRTNGDVFNALPTERNLAWAAGFFEGEGCFYANYNKPREDGSKIFRTHATLAQKDIELLKQFQNIMGFGSICNSSKDTKAWKTTRVGEATKVLEWFRPWLSTRRINTAERLLKKENKQILRPVSDKCLEGHLYTQENTIINSNRSGRICRICRNEYAKLWRSKQPAGYWRKYVH